MECPGDRQAGRAYRVWKVVMAGLERSAWAAVCGRRPEVSADQQYCTDSGEAAPGDRGVDVGP